MSEQTQARLPVSRPTLHMSELLLHRPKGLRTLLCLTLWLLMVSVHFLCICYESYQKPAPSQPPPPMGLSALWMHQSCTTPPLTPVSSSPQLMTAAPAPHQTNRYITHTVQKHGQLEVFWSSVSLVIFWTKQLSHSLTCTVAGLKKTVVFFYYCLCTYKVSSLKSSWNIKMVTLLIKWYKWF